MPYVLIIYRLPSRPKTQQSLERGHWLTAPIVAKDEFIEVNLELIAAYPVIGSDQPLLQLANRPIRQGHD